jgi:hypothetical protein
MPLIMAVTTQHSELLNNAQWIPNADSTSGHFEHQTITPGSSWAAPDLNMAFERCERFVTEKPLGFVVQSSSGLPVRKR